QAVAAPRLDGSIPSPLRGALPAVPHMLPGRASGGAESGGETSIRFPVCPAAAGFLSGTRISADDLSNLGGSASRDAESSVSTAPLVAARLGRDTWPVSQ